MAALFVVVQKFLDDEIKEAKTRVKRLEKLRAQVEEDGSDEEEDEDEDEEEPPKKKRRGRPPKKKVEEEDDEEEEEEEDEEVDIDPAKVKKAARAKLIQWAKGLGIKTQGMTVSKLRAALLENLDGEEAEEEDDDDEDEEEEKPKRRGRKSSKKSTSRRGRKKVEEEEEDDEEEDDEDDEEEEAPKSRRGRKSSSGKAGAAAAKKHLKVLQDHLTGVIEDNFDELEEAIEELGCGGDCYKCPTPEEDTVLEQVAACTKSVSEALELSIPKGVKTALKAA